ncbi:uncharacterized protein [Dysidea avara]|uniref:uncharacterized protein n=1 Tax=Dysidea avara TaxID=196820 RepID=UPI00332776FA
MTGWYSLISIYLIIPIVIGNEFTVNPGDIIGDENCSGKVDDFLCECCADSDTVNIHLLPGRHVFRVNNYPCYLTNKTSVVITGNSPNNTTILCDGFSIMLAIVQNVTISNITFEGCGGGMEDYVNSSFESFVYLGQGSRFVFLFIDSADITFSNVRMQNTLGYSIISFDAYGIVKLLGVHIENTNFQNDNVCIGYDYESDEATFSCSGSGVMFVYRFINTSNDSLIIDNCFFKNNVNIIPLKPYRVFRDAINVGYYRNPIPLVGAGCITLYFTQTDFPVSASITNTIFLNNTGSYSASVAITSVYSVLSQTRFNNCTFMNNNFYSTLVSLSYPYQNGGIKLLYLIVIGDEQFPNLLLPGPTESEMLAITHCNFVQVGGAIHIEKLAANNLTITVRIRDCNFTNNNATTGAVFTALDNRFRLSAEYTTISAIKILMTNVNAMGNVLYTPSEFVTGVFVLYNVQVTVTCNKECKFWNNNPSVFYGRNSELTLIGSMSFEYNDATNGGALHILNTVVFVHTGAKLQFTHNHAKLSGGAFNIDFTNTNVETQDICPIQFIGSIGPIFDLSDSEIEKLNVSISFRNNTVGDNGILESIFCNVFYRCSWFTDTVVQINLGIQAPVEDDRRLAVYRRVLTFNPPNSADNHTYIQAYLPCPCEDSGMYNFTACALMQTISSNQTVVPGRLFNISLVTVDIVGSVGYSRTLYSSAYENSTSGKRLVLDFGQDERPFSLVNRSCTSIEFIIYGTGRTISNNGVLKLSLNSVNPSFLYLSFTIVGCPVGFQKEVIVDRAYGCICDVFFNSSDGISCDTATGSIRRSSHQAWLGVYNGDLEYFKFCSPTYCHTDFRTFDLSEEDVLCTNHHSGRVCGECEDGYSRVFGSDVCRRCSSAWLTTILLYAFLGLLLLSVLYLLNFNVTLGVINGLIFFCNVMSINEELFFNTQISEFSFLHVFISLINLDLGFEICFYDGMSQLAKTGLQFVFPVYLWVLMFIIIYVGKFYFRSHKKLSSRSALPILATLLLLAYSKVLRTIINVLAFGHVKSSSEGSITVWLADPNIEYLTGVHIVLFIIGILFLLLFVLPFAIGLTFPSLILWSKKMSYFFPLFDCFVAPYKVKYRYWFGLRALVLLYIAIMEAVIFNDREAVLVSSITVVGFFALVQSYIRPFKNKIANLLDLTFMGIFLLLSVVVLYIYPSSNGFRNVNIAVEVLGYVSFVFFLLVVVYHIFQITKHTGICMSLVKQYEKAAKMITGFSFPVFGGGHYKNNLTEDQNYRRVNNSAEMPEELQFRESFLEHL